MKNLNKQILEAINKGINLALDSFEDDSIQTLTYGKVKNNYNTKEYLDLMNIVVDLGLPSGTLWCKYNLGVNPNLLSKAEDWYGDYYAWGELEPNKNLIPSLINKNVNQGYTKWSYMFIDSLKQEITKYNDNDNLIYLLSEDDAAYLNMHLHNFKFHIPTISLCSELLKYTILNSVYIHYNNTGGYNNVPGLNGVVLKSTINGNEIFFPGSGYYIDNKLWGVKHLFRSWTLRIEIGDQYLAHILLIEEDDTRIDAIERYYGLPIRPIINLK